jgi:cell division septation protein DedD
MQRFNLGKGAPHSEGEDSDLTLEVAEGSAGGGTKRLRLLVLLLVLLLAAAGYVAYTQFLAPSPQPPAPPVRPIAKAPPPAAPGARPGGVQPPAAPSGQAAGGAPGKADVQAKAAPPAKATAPATPAPAPAVPAGAEVKGPLAKKAEPEPAKVAKATPGPGAGAPPVPSQAAGAGAAAAAPGTFSLQVGAMVSEANAQRLKQRIEQLGYPAVILKGNASLRRHVVTVGDFADRAGAEEAAKSLAGRGIKGRVAPAGGRFSVEVGSFVNEDDAIDLAREVQKLNYPPKIQDLKQNTTVYQVRVGSYASQAEAQAKGAALQQTGIRYFVVKN